MPMTSPALPNSALAVDVVEINPHAPRPFAFTEAALCLRDSICAAGFRSELHVNQTRSRGICVVVGAVPPLLGPLDQLDPRKTIVLNLEQLASSSALAHAEYQQWLRKWLVVDYHSLNVQYLQQGNGVGQSVLELPLVPSRSIAWRPDLVAGKTVDVLFFGTLSERRLELLRRLEAAGITVETVSGAYAEELAPAVRRARIVLHVHYYSTGLFPVARVLQPVATGVPVVCESSAFSNRSDWSTSGILFAPYDGLVDACARLLQAPDEQLQRAQEQQQFAARIDFATPFALVLDALADRMEQASPKHPGPVPDQGTEPAAPGSSESLSLALSESEIEALLEFEASQLPPESHQHAPPIPVVERKLGQGRFGVWAVWLLLLFSLFTIWQSMR